MVQKRNAKVYFRIFPEESINWDCIKILSDQKTIYIRYLQELGKSYDYDKPIKTYWRFETDGVFYNNHQDEIYNNVMGEILDNLSQRDRKDAIIMGFGQTGTGKSLTMNGIHTSYEHRGILPRLVPELFANKASLPKNLKMCIQISYIEITRSPFLKDLLRKHQSNQINSIKDISLIKVRSEKEVFEYLFKGEGRKSYYRSNSHNASSIFTFKITTKNIDLHNPTRTVSKLHVIDLAGADTIGNSSCLFKDPWNVGNGNLAKSQLEQFVLVLRNRHPDLIKVKHRLNFILQYLGESLSTTNLLRFIGHIRTTKKDLLVTISMLRFGQIITGLIPSKYDDDSLNNRRNIDFSSEELDDLKAENLRLNNDLGLNLTQDRFAHVKRTVAEYLQNKTTELTLMNVSEAKVAMEAFKQLCYECEEEKKLLLTSQSDKVIAKRASSTNIKKDSKQVLRKGSSAIGKNKSSVENLTSSKSRSSTINSANKIAKVKSDTSKSRSSNISLMKKSSATSRRKSSSNASVFTERSKLKSRSDLKLMPEMIPEYKEAWNSYLVEKNEDYKNLLELYERTESDAKDSYSNYLKQVELLQDGMSAIEEMKNNVFLAGITRKYQQMERIDEDGNPIDSEIEIKLKDNLKRLQENKIDMQENVLKHQADFKMSMDFCRNVKVELKKQFDDFCKVKYQLAVENLGPVEKVSLIEKLQISEKNDCVGEGNIEKINDESTLKSNFERLRRLTSHEKRKIINYKANQRDWVN